MPTRSKASAGAKGTKNAKNAKNAKSASVASADTGLRVRLKKFAAGRKKAIDGYLARRPHRSFRRTRRRDYVRSLEMPGYIAFTHHVNKTVWGLRRLFIPLIIIYIVLYAVLVGIGSQDTYSTLSQTLQGATSEAFEGDLGALGQAGVLLVTIASSGTAVEATESQQIFSVFIFILIWLTTVWLLRNVLAGHKVRLRDGLYNSGSPIFSMVIILLIIAVQLLPGAAAVIGYTAAQSSGLLAGGAAAMLFWLGAALLCLLSVYWITSSLFAMIIITLPGMYPMKAISTAGDFVLGRRIRILLRWLWMILVVVLAWVISMLLVILFDMWLKNIWPALESIPLVPSAIVIFGACSTVWVSAYVYLFYRKVVDSGAE